MAKPKHGRLNKHARLISLPSSLGAHSTPPSPDPSSHPRRRRARPLSRPSPRFPSPAILSALAVIATAPLAAAAGRIPLPTPPPTFLCPFIERDNIDPSPYSLVALTPAASIPSSSAPPPAPIPSSNLFKREVVADKYIQGSDDHWRKTNAWTLYGSTCCSSSTPDMSGTPPQPSPSQTPVPTSTPSTAQFDTSVLPAGWDNTTNLNSPESTIILALAIILAGSICIFMIACVIWRKRKKRIRDIERKLAHKHGADDEYQEHARENDARGRIRMWVKASARWKSNVRQSARRRRKRPMVSSTINRPLSPTFSDPPPVPVVATSALSRRGSLASQEPNPPRPEPTPRLNATEPPAVLRDPPRFASPPTYRASFILRPSHPPSSAASNPNLVPSTDNLHAIQCGNQPSCIEDEPLPYIPPSDGHLATDDKAHLAHIQDLASSPPNTVDAAGVSTIQSVSAPEWHEVEDDLEDLGIDLSEAPMSPHNLDLPPTFPPPPSKADVPFGYLDDEPFRYGEDDVILASLPAPGLLGPSFGISPSAPPMDDLGLEPSAPCLEGEDELFQDWDGTSFYVPESPASADPNSTPTPVTESSLPSASRTSFPRIRESAARDGMLPRYYP